MRRWIEAGDEEKQGMDECVKDKKKKRRAGEELSLEGSRGPKGQKDKRTKGRKGSSLSSPSYLRCCLQLPPSLPLRGVRESTMAERKEEQSPSLLLYSLFLVCPLSFLCVPLSFSCVFCVSDTR